MTNAAYHRAFDGLTPRERKVYAAIVRKGCEPNEIAEIVGISANTVRQHQRHILAAFGVDSTLRLTVNYWTREVKRAKSNS